MLCGWCFGWQMRGYGVGRKEWFTLLSSYTCPASFMSQPRVDLPAAADVAVCLGCPPQDVPLTPPTTIDLYLPNWFQGEGPLSYVSRKQLANIQHPHCTHTYTRLTLCAVNANSIWDAGVWLTADLQSALPYAAHTHRQIVNSNVMYYGNGWETFQLFFHNGNQAKHRQ